MQRAVLYARTSDQDKTDRLESQLELGRTHCQRKGYHILYELSEAEKGASGAAIDLPQLEQVRDLASEGQFDVLVVRDLDRLSRSLVKQLIIEEELRRNGVRVEYVLADFEDTPEGKLQKHIRATVAEFERAKIQERTNRGIRAALKRGSVISAGKAPYGYLVRKTDQGEQYFEPEPREVQIVRCIFSWFVHDKVPAYRIAKRLTERKIPTWSEHPERPKINPRLLPSCHWSCGAVLRILKNETYTGTWTFGKKTEHPIYVSVPEIIDQATFDLAQRQCRQNKRRSSGRAVNALLARRVYCGHCGYKAQVLRPSGTVKWAYYSCPTAISRDHGRECNLPRFRRDLVDNVTWAWVDYFLQNSTQVLEQAAEVYQAPPDHLSRRLEIISTILQERTADWENLVETIKAVEGRAKATIAVDIQRLEDIIDQLEQEKMEVSQRLTDFGSTANNLRMLDQAVQQWKADVVDLRNTYRGRRRIVEILGITGTLFKEPDEQRFIELNHNLISLNPPNRLPLSDTTGQFLDIIPPDCINENLLVRLPLCHQEPGTLHYEITEVP